MTDITDRSAGVTERVLPPLHGQEAPSQVPPQLTAPPPKRWRMTPRWKRALRLSVTSTVIFVLFAAAGAGVVLVRRADAPKSGYFLASGHHRVTAISWGTPRNGRAQGHMVTAGVAGGGPATMPDSLGVVLTEVSVSFDGSRVTFTMPSGRTFSGTLSGGTLSVRTAVVSGTLSSSVPGSYTRAVSALKTAIAAMNSSTATRLNDSANLSAAQSDQAALQSQALRVAGDASQVANDVTRANADLATTRSAAAQGQGFNCQNIQNTVTDDAGTVLRGDQVTSLADDVRTLRRDLRTENAGITNLRYDLARLQLDKISPPAGAAGVLAAAVSAGSSAVTQANSGITQVNNDVHAGYAAANSLATGPCAQDGPGAAPAPQSLIG